MLSPQPTFKPKANSQLSYYFEEETIRLGRVIYAFESGQIDLEGVMSLYQKWVETTEMMVIQAQGGPEHDFDKKTIAVKCAKRGNDIYIWRTKARLSGLEEVLGSFCTLDPKKQETNAVFVTLTYNSKLKSVPDAWKDVGREWRQFIASLRKRYGEIQTIRAWQAYESGYPHVHAILIFKDQAFKTFLHQDKDGRLSLRIEESSTWKGLWHSFIDVEAPWSVKQLSNYIMRDSLRFDVAEGKLEDEERRVQATLSMQWLFRKRSFAISRILQAALKAGRLDQDMHNCSPGLDLFGLPIDDMAGWKWVFVGVYTWQEIHDLVKCGQKEGLWSYELTKAPAESRKKGKG